MSPLRCSLLRLTDPAFEGHLLRALHGLSSVPAFSFVLLLSHSARSDWNLLCSLEVTLVGDASSLCAAIVPVLRPILPEQLRILSPTTGHAYIHHLPSKHLPQINLPAICQDACGTWSCGFLTPVYIMEPAPSEPMALCEATLDAAAEAATSEPSATRNNVPAIAATPATSEQRACGILWQPSELFCRT